MSGGEYHPFTGDKGFEKRVVESAQHARNRLSDYLQPIRSHSGLHTIRVRLAEDYGARIVARANYWMEQQQ